MNARTLPPIDPIFGHDYTPASDSPWWTLTHPDTGIRNLEVARQRIKRYLCPADNPDEAQTGVILALHIYAPNAPGNFLQPTIWKFADHLDARHLATSNYFGVAGCIGEVKNVPYVPESELWQLGLYKGIFGNRSAITLGLLTVQDGTSNTLMIGESCGGSALGTAGSPRDYAFSWFTGALPTYYGLHGRGGPWYAFSSRHRIGVHFAFADCSVRGLRVSTDWRMLQKLAGRDDDVRRGDNVEWLITDR